jgi:hypothetical protein
MEFIITVIVIVVVIYWMSKNVKNLNNTLNGNKFNGVNLKNYNPENQKFPDRYAEIAYHKERALDLASNNNYLEARVAFLKWVESVKQQNINEGGKLEDELNAAKKTYSDFVKNDPIFIEILSAIFPVLKENPGILQTEIYKLFPKIEKNDLSYTLYFASDHGKIIRKKTGRTYSLYLKSDEEKSK